MENITAAMAQKFNQLLRILDFSGSGLKMCKNDITQMDCEAN